VLVYSTKITAAWRAAEARLGLLRDLPAAIMQVGSGPHAKILGASDRAEELVDHELPSFMVPGPDFDSAIETQFWMLFEKSGFELERTPDGKEKLVHIPEIASAIISKREKGLSSTYWVRLRSGKFDEDSRWLEVQGTPELGARSKNATSFSLITRPNQVRLEQLRQALALGGSV
jgi:hypothetical protein